MVPKANENQPQLRKFLSLYKVPLISGLALFLFIVGIQGRHVTFPIMGKPAEVSVMQVFLQNGLSFKEQCASEWRDQCVEIVKSFPLWQEKWASAEGRMAKRTLEDYLAQKGNMAFEIRPFQLKIHRGNKSW